MVRKKLLLFCFACDFLECFWKSLWIMCLCLVQEEFINPPCVYFDYLCGQGIGTNTSAFYIAWAQQLVKEGLVQCAVSVVQKGLRNQAQPQENLQQLYW